LKKADGEQGSIKEHGNHLKTRKKQEEDSAKEKKTIEKNKAATKKMKGKKRTHLFLRRIVS